MIAVSPPRGVRVRGCLLAASPPRGVRVHGCRFAALLRGGGSCAWLSARRLPPGVHVCRTVLSVHDCPRLVLRPSSENMSCNSSQSTCCTW
eukprot:6491382-Amphidinium_carterae.1